MSSEPRCPDCHGPLTSAEGGLRCARCGKVFVADDVADVIVTLDLPAAGDAQDAVVTQDLPADTQDVVGTYELAEDPRAAAVPGRRGGAAPLGELGRFRLLEVLGQGSFGTVYKAYDPVLERAVALKVPKLATDDPAQAERFLAEAKAAARLRHPNIVTVHDTGQAGPACYIVAEFIEGVPLSVRLERGRPALKLAVRWVRDLARALAYAHGQGIVHRDVKPANIMIDRNNRPLLTDFGLARRLDAGAAGAEEELAGTPAYMAPEQARGDARKVGPRSDQYALGAILYELLTGQRPHGGASRAVLARLRAEQPPAPPRQHNPAIPRALEAVCLRALATHPGDRYPDATELAGDLQHWLNDEPVTARPAGPLERARLWLRRHRVQTAVGVLAAVVLLVVGGGTALVISQLPGRDTPALPPEAPPASAAVKAPDAGSSRDEVRQKARLECADLRRRAAQLSQQGQYDHAALLLARALGAAESSDEALAGDVRQDLTEYEKNLFRLQLAAGGGEEAAGFGPDGRFAVTQVEDRGKGRGPCDMLVRLWDLDTARPVGKQVPHNNFPTGRSAFTGAAGPGGHVLLTRGPTADCTLQLWRAEAGEAIGEPLRHAKEPRVWLFSPDGKRLLTAAGTEVRLWDAATAAPAGPPIAREGTVREAAFSPDGRCFLVHSVSAAGAPEQHVFRLFDTNSVQLLGQPIRFALEPFDAAQLFAFSPDGRLLALCAEATAVRLYATRTAEPVGPPLPREPRVQALLFQADGAALLVHTRAGKVPHVSVWDIGHGPAADMPALDLAQRLFGKPPAPVQARDYPGLLQVSPDGRTLVTAEDARTLRLWDPATGRPVGVPIRHEAGRGLVLFSADGRLLFVNTRTGGPENAGRVYEAATGQPLGQPLMNVEQAWATAFSPDGRTLRLPTREGTSHLWDLAPRPFVTLVAPPDGGGFLWPPASLGFSPDGQAVLAVDSLSRVLQWDAATGKPTFRKMPTGVTVLALSPDHRKLLVSRGGKEVEIRAADEGGRIGEPLPHAAPVKAALFSADGSRIVTRSEDGGARVWDAVTGQPVGRKLQLPEPMAAFAVSPDGRLLASAGGTYTNFGSVWDVASSKALPTVTHGRVTLRQGIGSLAFSSTGKVLVTGGSGFLRLWDVATGEPFGPGQVLTPSGFGLDPAAVVFAPDDRTLLVAARAPEAKALPDLQLWDGTTGKPLGQRVHLPSADSSARHAAVAFSPDSRALLVGVGKTAELWDAREGKRLGLPLTFAGNVLSLAFSPDSRRVLVGLEGEQPVIIRAPARCPGDADGLTRLLQVETGLELADDGKTFRTLDGAAWQQRRHGLEQEDGGGGGR
jgi:WD40 repeat protein